MHMNRGGRPPHPQPGGGGGGAGGYSCVSIHLRAQLACRAFRIGEGYHGGGGGGPAGA